MQIVERDQEFAGWLEGKLLESLRAANRQAENANIVLAALESESSIIGGLVAGTSYGWLSVKILWVDENHRGSGVGRSLMHHAESSASLIGCHGAWLDTSSANAYQFYLKLGYEIFGELHNLADQNPPEHQRWFMRKSFRQPT